MVLPRGFVAANRTDARRYAPRRWRRRSISRPDLLNSPSAVACRASRWYEGNADSFCNISRMAPMTWTTNIVKRTTSLSDDVETEPRDLVLLPGNAQLPEVLFLPRRNPLFEVWSGHMYSAAAAYAASGINEIWDAREFEPFIQALRKGQAYRPKPENVLLTRTTTPETTAPGFASLFAAAEKNEAELYLLPSGGPNTRANIATNSALPPNGKRLPAVL